MVHRGVRDLLKRRLGVKRDTQPRRRKHVNVIGTIAHGHGLMQLHAGILSKLRQKLRLRRAVHHLADHPASEFPVHNFQRVGASVIQFQLLGQSL